MPVTDGLLENQPVGVLRDTGCSAVIVRGSLVSETKLSGQEARCVLIDGTVRRVPVAEIFLDSPYFTGTTTVVCMESPLYDVIVGNIPGTTDPTNSQPSSAVQTRSPVKETRAKPIQEPKKRISSPPVLRLPDVSQPFILQTDAFHLGVEAVLLQEDTAGEKRPIAIASRKLLPRERAVTQRFNENVSRSLGV